MAASVWKAGSNEYYPQRPSPISRCDTPEPLDLIALAFKSAEPARDLQPLACFGPEVTADPSDHTPAP
jgi:hypothetical protein